MYKEKFYEKKEAELCVVTGDYAWLVELIGNLKKKLMECAYSGS